MEIKMNREVLEKLKQDPKYLKYLRQNSLWYKTLNRDPTKYNEFVKAMKVKYKLTPSDKINRTIDIKRRIAKKSHI